MINEKEFSDIRLLRDAVGMTQREFARYFNIPLRTLIKWDSNVSRPAPYIVSMMEAILILKGDMVKSPLLPQDNREKNRKRKGNQ